MVEATGSASESSPAARGRARSTIGPCACAGRCEGGKLLLSSIGTTFGAGRRFLASVQNKLFENIATDRTDIFEDGHGYLGCSLDLIAQLA